MDRTVPAGAALLLGFIYETETSAAPPACYRVIFGNRQSALAKPLTSMTIDEVLAAQKTWSTKAWAKRFGSTKASSAAGAPQLMRATLASLKAELKLSGKEKLDGDMQDRLGFHLLKRRGYEDFMAGRISRTEFGKRLAQEWASFPVLSGTKGSTRTLKRGQSYYAGDGLNKALVNPAAVEALLDKVRAAGKGAPAAKPDPAPKPAPANDFYSKATVARVQQLLFDLGYTEVGSQKADGTFDGAYGKLTKAAILAFRLDNNLPLTGDIDDELIIALAKAKPRELPRQDAKPEEVRKTVPEVRSNWLAKIGALFTGIFAFLGSLVDGILGNLSAAGGYIQPLKDAAGDVPGWAWLLLIAVIAAALYLIARHGEAKGVEAFQSGERR